MVCRCGYHFTLHPQQDGLADRKFVAIVRAASGNGTYYFTLNQLYATYCRKTAANPLLQIGCGLLVALLAFVGLYVWLTSETGGSGFGIFIMFVSGMGVFAFVDKFYVKRPRSFERFARMVGRWEADGKFLEGMIREATLGEAPPEWSEPDIYDHGVERVVVVNRDLLVDWLVLNGFHAEQRAVIISGSGYPRHVTEQAQRCLSEQPELPVFFLHDATREPMGVHEHVAGIIGEHPQLDLGISLEDVRKYKRLRPVLKGRRGPDVPLDFLPYGMLANGAGMAMSEFVTLDAIRERTMTGEAVGGGYG